MTVPYVQTSTLNEPYPRSGLWYLKDPPLALHEFARGFRRQSEGLSIEAQEQVAFTCKMQDGWGSLTLFVDRLILGLDAMMDYSPKDEPHYQLWYHAEGVVGGARMRVLSIDEGNALVKKLYAYQNNELANSARLSVAILDTLVESVTS